MVTAKTKDFGENELVMRTKKMVYVSIKLSALTLLSLGPRINTIKYSIIVYIRQATLINYTFKLKRS